MTKRDTRRALTRLFADRDAAVTAYALAFLEKERKLPLRRLPTHPKPPCSRLPKRGATPALQ